MDTYIVVILFKKSDLIFLKISKFYHILTYTFKYI